MKRFIIRLNSIFKMKENNEDDSSKTVAVIVAHPDDETLWAGGTLLSHPLWDCFIISLCRGSDLDRAPKFHQALLQLDAKGEIGDLNDGPEQNPLPEKDIEEAILKLLPQKNYDLIITHNPNGEYTRHLRHEETSKAVIHLWDKGEITTDKLWTFAYEDGNKQYLPKAIESASLFTHLPPIIWQSKYKIITETYGFNKNSWEAQTTPKDEAFWRFNNSIEAERWLDKGGINL
jgi:LmbE family N-acetylglucosaminyl deacetylase